LNQKSHSKTAILKNSPRKKLNKFNRVVAVAGHICLDIIPSFDDQKRDFSKLIAPGALTIVGPALTVTGGAVSNTGLALHRLGIPPLLIAKIGKDTFGDIVSGLLHANHPSLSEGLIVDDNCSTSYTIVVSPPGEDRTFFHCPGANDVFIGRDIREEHLNGIRLFHFGYPPIMLNMFRNNGDELERLFQRIHQKNIVTSLDMAKPDPSSESGRADWYRILSRVLPYVDLFMPSLEELLYMIDRNTFNSMIDSYGQGGIMDHIDTDLLDRLAEQLIQMGTSVVGIKLGDQGLYLRSAAHVNRLSYAADPDTFVSSWSNRQLLAPCFRTQVAGTTGAGDCTIAGLLYGVLSGIGPVDAITTAVGVGACSTEGSDATSEVPSLEKVINRINTGWQRRDILFDKHNWEWDETAGVWKGPRDKREHT
jgi:sugar/nucleoside kinase (ribokinase family)